MMNIIRLNKNIDKLSDTELLEKYKTEQNRQYVGELFSRYHELTYLVCLKYLKDTDDAKDATMDIFEKLFEALLTNPVQNFKNWLYSVAKNHCLMILRKRKITVDIENLNNSEKNFVENEAEVNLLNDKKIENLREYLDKLKEQQKKCLILFYFEKKTYKEIAEKENFTIKQVKSYIQNGKRKLRILIENNTKED